MGTQEKGSQNRSETTDADGSAAEDGDSGPACSFRRLLIVDPAEGTAANLLNNRLIRLGTRSVEGALAGPGAAIDMGRSIGQRLVGAEAPQAQEAAADSIEATEG